MSAKLFIDATIDLKKEIENARFIKHISCSMSKKALLEHIHLKNKRLDSILKYIDNLSKVEIKHE